MARMTFEQASSFQNSVNSNYVQFFSLRDDGDEAVVRIMHDDVSSFDILSVHPVTVGDKYRSASCIRNDPHDPLDNCPLCKAGVQLRNVIYIHLIEYVQNEQGAIVPVMKVWERSLSYATRLKDMITEYGPLSQCVFKIRRSGRAGSRDTSYNILFANPQIYSPANYPIPEDAFKEFTALGTCVLDKNFQELNVYCSTGSFPQDNSNNNAATIQQAAAPRTVYQTAPPVSTPSPMVAPLSYTGVAYNNVGSYTANQVSTTPATVPEDVMNDVNTAPPSAPPSVRQTPWEPPTNPGMVKPVRYY